MPLTFKKRRRGRPWRRRTLLAAAGVALLLWAAGFLVFVYSIPRPAAAQGTRTDAIVVLTGGSQRLETALQLLADGRARELFVSGVHRDVDVAEILRNAGRDPGRLDCCIALDHNADDTIGNARETANWLAGREIASIRLVTAAYHMPRSLLEFEAALPGLTIVPHPVFPPHVKRARWYAYPGTAALFASEYSKYLAARARLTLERLIAAALPGAAPTPGGSA